MSKIKIKTPAEISIMRKSGSILAKLFDELYERVKPGVTTKELDKFAYDFIKKHRGKPSFKGQPGQHGKYPATICASLNEEVIHGIPGRRVLKEGDILSIDAGVLLRGYHSDAARTFPVGKIDESAQKLIDVTRASFFNGMEKLKAGIKLGSVSNAIQVTVEKENFSIVREFTGHGIGSKLHEPPQIHNFGTPDTGVEIPLHAVLAIEPMVNEGAAKVYILDDGWTVVTADNSLSAHYENTVLVTEEGYEILTKSECQ